MPHIPGHVLTIEEEIARFEAFLGRVPQQEPPITTVAQPTPEVTAEQQSVVSKITDTVIGAGPFVPLIAPALIAEAISPGNPFSGAIQGISQGIRGAIGNLVRPTLAATGRTPFSFLEPPAPTSTAQAVGQGIGTLFANIPTAGSAVPESEFLVNRARRPGPSTPLETALINLEIATLPVAHGVSPQQIGTAFRAGRAVLGARAAPRIVPPAPVRPVVRDITEVFPPARETRLPAGPSPQAPLALPEGPRVMPPAGGVISETQPARVLPSQGGVVPRVERPFILGADELAVKISRTRPVGRVARPVVEPAPAVQPSVSPPTATTAQTVADIPVPTRPRKVTPTPDGTVMEPSSAETAFLGLEPHVVGLSRTQRVMNSIAGMLGPKRIKGVRSFPSLFGAGRTQADPIVNPVVAIAKEATKRADDLANVERIVLNRNINKVFKFSNDGTFRIPSLAGVETRRPGGPTLRTVAARLPLYRERLSAEQLDVLEQIKETLVNPRETYNSFPIRDSQTGKFKRGVPASAPDILEDGGGFYMPLGGADSEQLDLPAKIISIGRRGGRTTTGAERGRVFTGTPDGPTNVLTQEEAIETLGYRYTHPSEAIGGFIQESGHRAATRYIGDALRQYGMTRKQIAQRLDPALFREMATLRTQIETIRRLGLKLNRTQSDNVRAFFEDPTFDDINLVFDAVDKSIQRGQFVGAGSEELRRLAQATKVRIAVIRPSYNRLLERARNARSVNGEAIAGIPDNALLANRKFPQVFADAASDQIQKMTPSGRIPVLGDFDSLYSGFRATADDSAIAIQGWLALFDNPVRWARTVAGHYRGFFDLNALGAFVDQRNSLSNLTVRIGDRTEVMPRVQDLVSRLGLRILGRRSAAAAVRGEQAGLSDIVFTKGKFNPFARLNNLFSLFGDRIRIDTMYDDITDALISGKTMDELWQSGDMRQMAEAVNTTTGFVDSSFGGPMGRRFLFAARWLQSRMEVVIQGAGAIRDPRILIETLPAGQRIAQASRLSTKQRLVGRRFWRLMNYGTALTVGINEWAKAEPEAAKTLGFEYNPTYLQPRVNGRINSNFMMVRWITRDWSAYGPFRSIYNLMHRAVTGRPDQAIRSLTSGSVQNAWDLISIATEQGDFRARSELGEKAVINSIEKFTGDRPDPNKSKLIQIGGRLLENFMTFNTEEVFESGEIIGEGNVATGSVGVAVELAGVQSTLLSPSDLADRHAKLDHLPSIDAAENYQKRISFSYADVEARREGFPINRHQARIQEAYDKFELRVQELVTGKDAEGLQIIDPRVNFKDRAFLYLDAQGTLFDQLGALREFDDSKFPEPIKALNRREVVTNEDAVDAWYAIRKMRSSINPRRGQPGGQPLEDNRQLFLNHRLLRPEQRAFVLRNINLTLPPEKIMEGMRSASPRTWSRINDSEKARKAHLRSIGANPDLTETLRVLP